MNEAQIMIAQLQEKGWTLAAIAGVLEVTVNAVEKWKAGARYPANPKATLTMMGQLARRKQTLKMKRYSKTRIS